MAEYALNQGTIAEPPTVDTVEATGTVDSTAVATKDYRNTIKDPWMPQELGESYLLDTDSEKQFATLERVQEGPPLAYSSSTPSELDNKDSEQVSKADTAYALSLEPTEGLLQTLDRGNAQHNHPRQKHNSMTRIWLRRLFKMFGVYGES